ncbi:ABC transporter transmembrane domain-containing protein [Enterobacter cloacae complex sp. 2DZ2F20B]|uniref:ABC transporter transmembrane domain-containing protein n=1 Tax=Enterobacter cloacae complex sp. 2DZ2F20B TaxID=2511993 RepID=UPI001013021C|nr:hypothetical protein DD592_27775 [Enterobacter cloacae complex sp. 2DZ2F20B]
MFNHSSCVNSPDTEKLKCIFEFQIFKVRSLYLEKVLNQDISWYDLNNTGDFSSRMSE